MSQRPRDTLSPPSAGTANPQELSFEVVEGEVGAVKQIVVEHMTGAYPLDPPLDIDTGVGTTWLDAK